MSSATVTRPAPSTRAAAAAARSRAEARLRRWEWLGLAALCLGAAIGFLFYPTYPNYDSIYSMLWGREVLDLQTPSFRAYRAPTEHPLAIAIGALLSVLGDGGDRVWVALTVASFVALVVGLYALGKEAFTPLVGAVAAVLLITRFDFPFLAARGYIDPAYLALVVWAAVLELRRPRRGTVVLALLALAGLLRPEGWLLAGLYWLWLLPGATWAQRLRWALLVGLAPIVWTCVDYAVTGDPLFSLNGTSELAAELGRNKGAGAVPSALWSFLVKLAKFPVVAGGLVGAGLALLLVPLRLRMPLVLFAVGVANFALVGAAGLSVIDRYLLVPSLMVMVLCGVALGGWTMLREGTLARRAWAAGAVALVVFGVAFTASRVNVNRLHSELRFRGDAHHALEDVLRSPAVAAGLRCGPLLVPNHKLVPDARWILGLAPDRVVARSDPEGGAGRVRGGVAVIVHGRAALFSQVLVGDDRDLGFNLPPFGYERRAVTRYYAAYVRC